MNIHIFPLIELNGYLRRIRHGELTSFGMTVEFGHKAKMQSIFASNLIFWSFRAKRGNLKSVF